MKNPYNKYEEFGTPPEEFTSSAEYEDALKTAKNDSVNAGPAPEDFNPGPEIVAPGEYKYSQRSDEYKKFVKKFVFFAAAVFMIFFGYRMMGINFFGSNPEYSGNGQSNVAPADIDPAPTAIPPEEDTSIPLCEITAFNFSSEMHVDCTFSDMNRATKVVLEIWDVNFLDSEDGPQEIYEITEEAKNDLFYSMEPFYTDNMYNRHYDDYYNDSSVPFPMEIEARVIIDYGDGEQVVYTARTKSEPVGFHMKYLPDSEKQYSDEYYGMVIFMADPSPQYPSIDVLIGEPEKVTDPSKMSIKATVDGKEVDTSLIKFNKSTYHTTFADGQEADITYTDVLIKRPEGIAEDSGKKMHLEITHYLSSSNKPYTSVQEIEFDSHPYHG